jgi:hypothetical protein
LYEFAELTARFVQELNARTPLERSLNQLRTMLHHLDQHYLLSPHSPGTGTGTGTGSEPGDRS